MARPNLIEITDALERELIAPPLIAGQGACPICSDIEGEDERLCFKCRMGADVLGAPLTPVVPITLYVKPSALRELLTRYKDEAHPESKALAIEVAAILDRFFLEHGAELARRYGEADAATVVPTKWREPGEHPLSTALDLLPAQHLPPRESVLRLGPGKVDRRTPDPQGFIADESVRSRAILVLDDVYTTGATAQSAAHALRAAGAHVPAIVVIGRRLNPGVVPGVGELVERQRARGFAWRRSPWT
jgi:hypothetical protein